MIFKSDIIKHTQQITGGNRYEKDERGPHTRPPQNKVPH